MGNGFSVSRPRAALQQKSKWTIENGQVFWDGRPWPPRRDKVNGHADQSGLSRPKRPRTGSDGIVPPSSSRSRIDLDQSDDITILDESTSSSKLRDCSVRIKKLNIKKLQNQNDFDTSQVKRKRGRPRKYSLKQEQIQDVLSDPLSDDNTDMIANEEHRAEEPSVEKERVRDHVVVERVNTDAALKLQRKQEEQTKAALELLKKQTMPRTYSVSSGARSSTEDEESSSSDDSTSDSESESEPEELDIVSFEDIKYGSKSFYVPKLVVKNDMEEFNDKVKNQLVYRKGKFFNIQEKFFDGKNLTRDLNCFIKQEYCKALHRFKHRTSLQIQLMLLMAYLKYKVNLLEDDKKSVALRVANIKVIHAKKEKEEEGDQ